MDTLATLYSGPWVIVADVALLLLIGVAVGWWLGLLNAYVGCRECVLRDEDAEALTFTWQAAADLMSMWCRTSDGSVVVTRCEGGHSGPGLYAHFTDYPEEGAFLLGEGTSRTAPKPKAVRS